MVHPFLAVLTPISFSESFSTSSKILFFPMFSSCTNKMSLRILWPFESCSRAFSARSRNAFVRDPSLLIPGTRVLQDPTLSVEGFGSPIRTIYTMSSSSCSSPMSYKRRRTCSMDFRYASISSDSLSRRVFVE